MGLAGFNRARKRLWDRARSAGIDVAGLSPEDALKAITKAEQGNAVAVIANVGTNADRSAAMKKALAIVNSAKGAELLDICRKLNPPIVGLSKAKKALVVAAIIQHAAFDVENPLMVEEEDEGPQDKTFEEHLADLDDDALVELAGSMEVNLDEVEGREAIVAAMIAKSIENAKADEEGAE